MLKASGLKKSYGTLPVLKGVNIEIQKGEVVAIVGASGAGKSTLLHILGSLDIPDEGEVKVNGTNLFLQNGKMLAEFRNKNLGFVFQFHNLLPEFTAIENVMIPALIAKEDQKKIKDRANELLKSLGLESRIAHKPSELSGGEQQRVAVARALINSPLLIFADEPSGNLDSKNATELHQLFFQLRKDFNQTFVIATHNQEFASMADRKLEIKDGVILS
ncbi:MAG: ABC transporter ATP-binding protein [Bacteroidetes bacterium]|nr:ABC transporter ATP-binding protein [Bacteroidota bacterium]MBI3482667.1 ABC transporter ATP-binding protein [Bacteroidota bacterium]